MKSKSQWHLHFFCLLVLISVYPNSNKVANIDHFVPMQAVIVGCLGTVIALDVTGQICRFELMSSSLENVR
jgi:hypothetical protein